MSERITPEWLEQVDFYQDAERPLAYLLRLPDDMRPNVQSYLQMVAPTRNHGWIWTAELVNVVEGEWVSVAIPRPISTRGNVLFLMQAVGAIVLNPYELQTA